MLNFTSLVVALLGIVFLAEMPTRLQWGGMLVFLAGILLYFYPVDIPAGQTIGLLVVCGGVLANSLSSILGRAVNRSGALSPLLVTVISMGVGAVLLLVSGLVVQGLPPLELRHWAIIAWLAVVNTALAFPLWNHTLRTLSAMESSVINSNHVGPIAIWLAFPGRGDNAGIGRNGVGGSGAAGSVASSCSNNAHGIIQLNQYRQFALNQELNKNGESCSMKLHEYQSKQLFAKYGIPIPKGRVASNADEAKQIARELGGRVVVKSQVLVGGRGKAGGIRLAKTPDEAADMAAQILAMEIKGLPVRKVLIDEAANIGTEIYLGITNDRTARKPVMMASSAGGVEIEEVARETPEKIIKVHIDPLLGLRDYQVVILLPASICRASICASFC
jgi:hypothetical protein